MKNLTIKKMVTIAIFILGLIYSSQYILKIIDAIASKEKLSDLKILEDHNTRMLKIFYLHEEMKYSRNCGLRYGYIYNGEDEKYNSITIKELSDDYCLKSIYQDEIDNFFSKELYELSKTSSILLKIYRKYLYGNYTIGEYSKEKEYYITYQEFIMIVQDLEKYISSVD